MRILSEDFDKECAGTTEGDRLVLTVWRGGRLAVPGELDVTAWSFDWDAGRVVQGQATFTVADPDGTLAPWALEDPLGPGGSRVRPVWVSGLTGTRIPLGVWRIRSADPTETWLFLNGGAALAAGGGSVTIHADEEMASAQIARLDAESWAPKATVLGEVTRLLADTCAVVVDPSIKDRAMPADYVYGDELTDAVDDLLGMVDATCRFDGSGALEVIPSAGVATSWLIAGGEDGVLVTPTRSLSDANVVNTVVSSAQGAGGVPIVKRAEDITGTLGVTSPFGRARLFHQSPSNTEAGVQADANTLLRNRTSVGEIDLSVLCLAHPGLQVHDVVTLATPSLAGEQPIRGRVVKMSLASASSSAHPAKTMRLTLRVSTEALGMIAARVRRAVAQ